MTSFKRRGNGDDMPPRAEERPGCRRIATLGQIALALLVGSLVTLLVIAFLARGLISSLLLPSLNLPWSAPTPQPTVITGAAVVQEIQQLERLETSSYSIQTVVTAERPGGFAGIGHQKVLIIVHGTVTAGIDLSKLKPQDVTVSPDGKRVKLKLPEAEILSKYLDESRTDIYDFQTGLFTRPDASLITEAQRSGAGKVLQAACDDGIMARATTEGQHAVEQMLKLVGFDTIEFENTPVPPCPVPPT